VKVFRAALALAGIAAVSSVARWFLRDVSRPFDLFLVAVVFVALFRSPMAAQLFALAAGLTQDAIGGEIIGINALSKTVIAYAVAGIRQVLMIRGAIQRTAAFFLGSLADAALYAGVCGVFSLPFVTDPAGIAVKAVANSILGIIAVLALQRRMEGRHQESEYEIS
jgi:rod shape-determining protein MreD